MLQHKESHRRDRTIKIGKVHTGNYKGSYRPHEHQYNRITNNYGHGPGATVCSARYPDDCIRDGQLVCRKCDKDLGPISKDPLEVALRAQAIRAEKFNKHEDGCRL